MATSVQPKKKAKKYQHGLRNDIFTRLQFVIAFETYPPQLSDDSSSLMDSYLPRVLGSCTLAWYLPRSPVDINAYRRCIVLPGQPPYLDPPSLPSPLPPISPNPFIFKPTHPSLLLFF